MLPKETKCKNTQQCNLSITSVDIDIERIRTNIISLQNSTSPGCSGISNEYLKKLINNQYFINTLKLAFEQMLNNPNEIGNVPHLFQFLPMFIPKDDGGFRPIAL